MEEELLLIVHIDSSTFVCAEYTDPCPNRERTISYATFVTLPDEATTQPDLQFNECCYQPIVLADTTGKLERNDYSGFYYGKQLPNETCTFFLVDLQTNEEHEITNNLYGRFKNFGEIEEQPKLSTFVVFWSKVLAQLGEGAYQVKKHIVITGIAYDELSNVFNLKTYSDMHADKTIRMDIAMNGLMEKQNVDFSGSQFMTSLRLGGYFGNREPKYEEDNIVFRDKRREQISMKMINVYKMQTELIPECISSQIFDFYLFADEIFLNDYNLNNHSYKLKNIPVSFENNEGTGYYALSRKARLNLTFKDRYENKNKFNY